MSLGLFNCRLIQPAGDQLFFLSAVSPHRCPFARVLFSLLVTSPARPRPAGGRRMLLVFPSQKGFVWVFRGCAPRRVQEGFPPTDSATNSRGSTDPTHRFCYRALIRYTPSDCFETFPFPPRLELQAALENAGQAYYD